VELQKYTTHFNADFIGVSGKIENIRKLQSQLGVYSAREDNSNNYQLQHTASIMLISPEAKWVGMFKFGLPPIEFEQAVLSAIATVSQSHA
jgi:protein SCO1